MYTYLSSLFVGLLILSNIISVKLFEVGGAILPAAAIVYVVTYLLTDVINEVYGKEKAMETIKAGFFTQVVALIFIYLAIQLPASSAFSLDAEFNMILGGSLRVVSASLLAYLFSQTIDVSVFHALKQKHGKKKLWVRNNASTLLSQLIDTTVFISVAFVGLVPFPVLVSMIISQYIFKMIVAIIDTPIAYLLVKIARKEGVVSNKKLMPSN